MLRALVYLKRISVSLDKIARAQEAQSAPVIPPRRPKLAEVWTATPDKMNELYDEDQAT